MLRQQYKVRDDGRLRGQSDPGLEKLLFPAGDVQPLPAARDHIIMHLGAPVTTRRSLDGKTQHRLQLFGDFDVIPAGMAGRWRNEQSFDMLLIEIEPAFTARIFGGDRARPLLPAMQLRDPHLQNLALALMDERWGTKPAGRLYTESLVSAMLARLMSFQSDAPAAPAESGDRFSIQQQRCLAEYIEANLAADLSLPSLAGVIGYGLSRFKTLFNNSFGCTPHGYVMRRRIDRARVLIEAGVLPLSEVALETGFSHQSHMAAAIRQSLGVSPGQLRRAVKA